MNNYKGDILIWVCVIMAIVILVLGGRMYSYSEVLAHGPSPSKKDQAILNNCITEIENLRTPTTSDSISSLVEAIRRNQLLVLHQQENLINDFRQEMNNNINKTNTWLAYAIGIMSLVGVFIPVAIQFRIRSDEKELSDERKREFKRKLDELNLQADKNEGKLNHTIQLQKKDLADCIDNWRTQFRTIEENVERYLDKFASQEEKNEAKLIHSIASGKEELGEFKRSLEDRLLMTQKNIDKQAEDFQRWEEYLDAYRVDTDRRIELNFHSHMEDVRRSLDSFKSEIQFQQICARFMSFSCSYEDRAINDLPERSILLKYIWVKAAETFSDIVSDRCKETSIDEQDRISILMCLVMMNAMILKIRNSNDIKIYRKFDAIKDEIVSIINLMVSSINNHAVVHGISERLKQLNLLIIENPLG